jgi:hypothetical protein
VSLGSYGIIDITTSKPAGANKKSNPVLIPIRSIFSNVFVTRTVAKAITAKITKIWKNNDRMRGSFHGAGLPGVLGYDVDSNWLMVVMILLLDFADELMGSPGHERHQAPEALFAVLSPGLRVSMDNNFSGMAARTGYHRQTTRRLHPLVGRWAYLGQHYARTFLDSYPLV